jgi:hypothetical protein
MPFYLGGKISVSTNDVSPKQATAMSRDIKCIGMDVHKEAIVIAVLNGSGKLVMETILETKASSILQFIHGLRKVTSHLINRQTDLWLEKELKAIQNCC